MKQNSGIFSTFNLLFFLVLLALNLSSSVQAQYYPPGTQHFAELYPDSVIRMTPQMSQMLFEPGELIVRFRDEVEVSLSNKNGLAQTGISSVDDILEVHQVVEAGKLIPGAGRLLVKEMLTAPTGRQFERPSLHNIYLLRTEAEPYELFPLIQALKDDPSVLYAEPNYLYAAVGAEPLSPKLSEAEMLAWLDTHSSFMEQERRPGSKTQPENVYEPNDPLYGQQWGFAETQVNQVWTTTTGSSDAVIAILDTGVDYNHPDLAGNIWTNPGETLNGSDSDGNGFVDDIRGWDFVNQNNSPMDDNSHGTHVAGIAAAEGDNGIGIAGVNWHAQIMPVKVLQSSGFGTVATIVQGINYAAQNGATVINMSFGSYARSLAMEDALANAYATAVLLAAAGNDVTCIGPGLFCAPFFPAAISYVLGVETPPYPPSGFTNFDQDGPVFSLYPELWNYELSAPGVGMISTIPNGGYRVYSGTSMAAPFAAGAISLYREFHPEQSQEMLWGNFINTRSDYIQLKDAIEVEPLPVLSIISRELVDTLNGDGDGHPDVGETIELWLTLRNTWGQADNVQVKLQMAEFEDPTVANITNDQATIGSISAYATRTNENDPFVLEIAENLVHGRHIMLEALVYELGTTDTIYQPIMLTITNAVKVSGLITGNTTWTNNNTYLVTSNIAVPPGSRLTIEPGTIIRFDPGYKFVVDGELVAAGKKDSLITFTKNQEGKWGYIELRGAHNNALFDDEGNLVSGTLLEHTIIEHAGGCYTGVNFGGVRIQNAGPCIRKSVIRECSGNNLGAGITGSGTAQIIKNKIYRNYWAGVRGSAANIIKHNLIFENWAVSSSPIFSGVGISTADNTTIEFNNILLNSDYEILTSGSHLDTHAAHNNWFGTTDESLIEERVYHYLDDFNRPLLDFMPYLLKPDALTPGIVWKILINGADAQNEFVEPVGIGQHEFKVYFNRAMNPDNPPQITFGVRAPYTQQAVSGDGEWSEDFKVYTAYATVGLLTGDGINRVRVSGARDPNGFEIPVEDSRFEFLIDAAAGASTAFTAIPGMGRIDLDWEAFGEIEDVLGYNLYRFEMETDTTFTEPVLLNQQLVLDTEYTDFEVLPGDAYFYYYKILRTNMAETDSSRVVTAIPHTAAPGDANGDYNVNVMDIVAIVAYMLNQNPQPFIFEAADVNQDSAINVMDIVGVVNMIMSDKSAFLPNPTMHPDPAYVHFKDDIVQIESDGQLVALQFKLHTAWPGLISLTSLLPGFELGWTTTDDGVFGVIFSMTNKCIPEGITDIIRINHTNPDLHWHSIFGSDPGGRIVEILTTPLSIDDEMSLPMDFAMALFPNPANTQFTINYFLPVRSDVHIDIYDLFGRKLHTITQSRQAAGEHFITKNTALFGVSQSLVLVRMTATGADGIKFSKTVKLMLK